MPDLLFTIDLLMAIAAVQVTWPTVREFVEDIVYEIKKFMRYRGFLD